QVLPAHGTGSITERSQRCMRREASEATAIVIGMAACHDEDHRGGGRVDERRLRHQGAKERAMLIVLWVIAGILALSGVLALFRKEYKWGIVFLIAACVVGPMLTAFLGGPPAGPRS